MRSAAAYGQTIDINLTNATIRVNNDGILNDDEEDEYPEGQTGTKSDTNLIQHEKMHPEEIVLYKKRKHRIISEQYHAKKKKSPT